MPNPVNNDSPPLTPSSIPTLWRLARLDFDQVRQQHVLLYPEGAVLLNETGAAILQLCDGRRSLATIAQILGERYKCDVLADVTEYLSQLAERELIRDG
jgi:pyrroloquinoline quinone biosynthesis protein D